MCLEKISLLQRYYWESDIIELDWGQIMMKMKCLTKSFAEHSAWDWKPRKVYEQSCDTKNVVILYFLYEEDFNRKRQQVL